MPIITNHVRCAVHTQSGSGEQMVNILWYTFPDIPGSGDEQAAVQAFVTQLDGEIASEFKGMMSATCMYRGVEGAMSVGGNVFTAASDEGAGAGTNLGDCLPSYAAAVIQKRTPNGGRAGRGRWYIGGIAEVITTGSRLTGPGQTAGAALAAILMAPINVAGTGIFTPAHLMGGATLAPITGTRCMTTLGTMRRRLVRVGL